MKGKIAVAKRPDYVLTSGYGGLHLETKCAYVIKHVDGVPSEIATAGYSISFNLIQDWMSAGWDVEIIDEYIPPPTVHDGLFSTRIEWRYTKDKQDREGSYPGRHSTSPY